LSERRVFYIVHTEDFIKIFAQSPMRARAPMTCLESKFGSANLGARNEEIRGARWGMSFAKMA